MSHGFLVRARVGGAWACSSSQFEWRLFISLLARVVSSLINFSFCVMAAASTCSAPVLFILLAAFASTSGALVFISPLIRVFHNSPTTHHNPPQLTTTVVGELWVSCGELWWACHNSPQNGWQLWQGILWPPQVATIRPQLPPQRATTCHNIPPFNHILPQFYHILPHFTTISMRFASFHSIIIINYA